MAGYGWAARQRGTGDAAGRVVVRRDVLLARMDRAAAAGMVLLVAPGGYGKTTVLRQWAEGVAAPHARVPLAPRDDDPAVLALRLALALREALPSGAGAARLPEGTRARSRLDPADLLGAVAELRRLGRPVAVVVDDLHEIRSPASLGLLRAVVEAGGPVLRVAAAGRVPPEAELPALAAAGRCLWLGPADLAFSEDEVRQVLAAAGRPVGPDVAREVADRTEGWPAGVYLAALVARQEPGGLPASAAPSGPGAVISGDDVYVADYFRDEVLVREPADNVRFLLRTSVLDRMCAPLCDAVLGTTGSATRLREAARRGLFVVPLDGQGRWYRYHRLFREMLRTELRLREPDEELRLHRRAAAWLESEDLPDEAIAHALAGGDTLRAARLVELRARQTFAAGRKTVYRRLDGLDDELLAVYPPLAVTAGWIWAFSGRASRARDCLAAARAARFAGPLPDGSSSLDSAVSLLSAYLAPLGVERMLDDARRAVELEPPGAPPRPVALTALGVAHLLNGRPGLGVPALTEAARLGRDRHQEVAALAHAELAVVALTAGEDGAADAAISASLALLEEAGAGQETMAVLPLATAAWAAARRGDGAAWSRHAASAGQISDRAATTGFPWYAPQVSIVLARAALAAGDPPGAAAHLVRARRSLGHLLTEGVLREQVDEVAHLLGRAGGRAGPAAAPVLTEAEDRVLQLLPTHLSLGEIAEELHVSRNTVKSQVTATYRKLQAVTRAEAVRRGRELGLLAGGNGDRTLRQG